jgi:transposase
LSDRLKAELLREIEVIELLLRQIAEVEAERDADAVSGTADRPSPVTTLMRLKAVGWKIMGCTGLGTIAAFRIS